MTDAIINYVARTEERPFYHANDVSRDRVPIDPRTAKVANARALAIVPDIDREGFALFTCPTAIADFRDDEQVAAIYPSEIHAFLMRVTGADAITLAPRGILRFGERDADSGQRDNSRPARFAHIDISDATAAAFADRTNPHPDRMIARYCHFNLWRAFSGAPQDVPLAMCDARTVSPDDLIFADAIFDAPGVPIWSFEGLVIAANPAHRWLYFPDMSRDELILFKTKDSDPARAHHVPHVAFDDPACPADAAPRSSIEMRATAYWYA